MCILLCHGNPRNNLCQTLSKNQPCQAKLPIAGSFPWEGALGALSSAGQFCPRSEVLLPAEALCHVSGLYGEQVNCLSYSFLISH